MSLQDMHPILHFCLPITKEKNISQTPRARLKKNPKALNKEQQVKFMLFWANSFITQPSCEVQIQVIFTTHPIHIFVHSGRAASHRCDITSSLAETCHLSLDLLVMVRTWSRSGNAELGSTVVMSVLTMLPLGFRVYGGIQDWLMRA